VSTTRAQLTDALRPVTATIAALDLSQPAAAQAALTQAFDEVALDALDRLFAAASDEGWLTPRQASADVSFGRLAKPSAETHGLSIDVVDMSGPGAAHAHPKGEVSLCFPRAGAPHFEGVQRGWAILPPGSRHIPTVLGGRMVIAYFLPEGAMDWS
jgi:hypothetical protein